MNNKPYKYTIQYKMGLVKASEVDISGSVHEKIKFKDMYCNQNLQTQIDKVHQNKPLNGVFGCFLSTSLKEDMDALSPKFSKLTSAWSLHNVVPVVLDLMS